MLRTALLLTRRKENLSFMLGFPPLLFVLAVFFEYSGLDIWWVSHFYDAQNQVWPYRGHWLFDTIIHSGGQRLDWSFAVLWLLLFIFVNLKKQFRPYRKILLFFVVATAAGPILVGIGKSFTHIASPWDLHRFNGIQPYIRMLDPVPVDATRGHAFPAGHASGGYCFLSVYFVLLRCRSSYRGYGLFFGIIIGLIFGVGQQIRGAHFPSHDLVTIIICWYASLVCYFLFYPQEWQVLKRGNIFSCTARNE
ncbi:Membrane-associated enzyme, PAP2 (acid phosphatase) superfamily [Candidatus Electrothrix aarhusensis]|uniref:Membrane-associated enzyme, PAP2 (Acid phosphatase) superfamily n=1 Tax=Candidatus Electrothrix aarhusensis TaxID=1859131 RepID=A0A444IQA6_9BACT|nr:Membrane-associated enzyme, PAP2 (acid phosphatase) superfamily [Candidatus Electrothrix aarhusensis]